MTTAHKITSCLTAAALLSSGAFNALPRSLCLSAGEIHTAADLAEMTASVRSISSTAFEELRYNPNEQQFYRDGVPVGSTCGKYSAVDGKIVIAEDTGNAVPAAAPEMLSAEQASDLNGCEITVENGETVIRSPFQTARLIVKSNRKIDPLGGTVKAKGYHGLTVLQYSSESDAYAAYQQYLQDGGVIYAAPDRIRVVGDDVFVEEAPASAAEPSALSLNNIPEDQKSWGYHAIGADNYLQWLKSVREELPTVTVAVVDTGIYAEHSWFKDRIHPKPADFTETGIASCTDVFGHGTHCAGIVCQSTPENVRILPVKVLNDSGYGTDLGVYCGMMYAMENGADVISMSLGGEGDSPMLEEAVRAAEQKQIPIIAAAGNDANDALYHGPGNIPAVVTVSALQQFGTGMWEDQGSVIPALSQNQLTSADYSNYGDIVDFAAPGSNIASASISGPDDVVSMSGTSMATPFVAAAYANILSYQPDMEPQKIYQLLKDHSLKTSGTSSMNDEPGAISLHFSEDEKKCYGNGMICLTNLFTEGSLCSPTIQVSVKPDDTHISRSDMPVTVTIIKESEADIYYTLDGTEPSAENGTLYEEPFTVSKSCIVKAFASDGKGLFSKTSIASICIDGKETDQPYAVEDGVLVSYNGVMTELDLEKDFPDGTLTAIGDGVFSDRYITKVTLPDSVKSLGNYAFYNCCISELTAHGVTELGCFALSATNIYNADLGTVSKFGTGAFMNSETMTLMPRFSKDITVIPDFAFCGCKAMYLVNFDWENITEIGTAAFALSGLNEEINLPKIRKIGDSAFQCTKISLFSLPDTVTVMPDHCLARTGCRLIAHGLTEAEDCAMPELRYDYIGPDTDAISYLGYDPTKITKVGEQFMGYGEVPFQISFDNLESANDFSFYGTGGCTLTFPKYRDSLKAFVFTEALINLPVMEEIQLIDIYAEKLRFSSALKSVIKSDRPEDEPFIEGRFSELKYLILPENSPMIPYAEEYGAKYYIDDEISGLEETYTIPKDSSAGEPVTISAEYVYDEGCFLKWYLQFGNTETSFFADKADDYSETPTFDLTSETVSSQILNREVTGIRVELWRDDTVLDSKTAKIVFSDDPNPSDNQNDQTNDEYNPYNTDYKFKKPDHDTMYIVPGKKYLVHEYEPEGSMYLEHDSLVSIHTANRGVRVQALLINRAFSERATISDTSPGIVTAGKNEFMLIHTENHTPFLRDIVFWVEVEAVSIEKAQVQAVHAQYTGKAVKPQFSVKLGDETLTEGTDYTLDIPEGADIIEPGRYLITIKGTGKYFGECKGVFIVFPNDESPDTLKEGTATVDMQDAPNGRVFRWTPDQSDYCIEKLSAQPGTVTISKEDGTQLLCVEGVEYRYSMFTAEPGTTYLVSVRNNYTEDSAPASFRIESGKRLLDDCTVEMDQLTLFGEKPVYTLKDQDTVLKEGTDYEVIFRSNEKHLGKNMIIFRGKGKYAGENSKEFYFYPADPDDDDAMPDPIGPEISDSTPIMCYRIPDMFVGTEYPIEVSNRMPGYLERYTLTVPESGIYELMPPDPVCMNATLFVYIDDQKPFIPEETTLTLEKGQVCRFLFVHDFLPQSEIIGSFMTLLFSVRKQVESVEKCIGNVNYRLIGENATVLSLADSAYGAFIPETVTDPDTGKEYKVTDVDGISFAPFADDCTFLMKPDNTLVSFCKEHGYSYALLNLYGSFKGDADGDGSITHNDVIVLQRYLTECSGMEALSEYIAETCDLNEDSILDLTDLFLLMKLCPFITHYEHLDESEYEAP
ncbi:MAG: S8 family serine peptidase [Oscillospiraceae bacterium]|nr:S8 family serine peptidase [Oscillospiraceae bacterium]